MLNEPEVKFASKPSVPFDQLKIKSSFSLNEISGFKSGAPNAASPEADSPAPPVLNREVSAEEVSAAILKYAETKQNEGSRQIATILKTAGVSFQSPVITLTINNETQREQFMLVRQHFIDDLRIGLQNSGLNLSLEISKSEMQAKAYRPVDIFKAMSDKNPALLELKKRFDLEIDY